MEFPVEIWVRGENDATLVTLAPVPRAAEAWTDADVATVLTAMLRALDRAKDPSAEPDRPVSLRGFSWIVNPFEDGGVLIALELSIGAVVAGPFNLAEPDLTARIQRAIANERRGQGAPAPETVH